MKKAFAAIAAAALVFGGCAGETTRDTGKVTTNGDIGTLDMKLTTPGGTVINSVLYTITGGSLSSPMTKSIDLTNSSQLKFQVGNIPVSTTAYSISLSATTANNGGIPCSGTAPFTMDTNQVKALSMNLGCTGTNTVETDDKGDLRVTVAVSVVNGVTCPVVTGISALPLETAVGSNLQLEGFLSSTSGTTVAWTGAGGTFVSASSAATAFTCTAGGDHDLTFTVNKTGCTANAYSVTVTCTGDAGTPPPVDSGAPDTSVPPPVDSGAPDTSVPPPVDSGAPDTSVPPPVDSGAPDSGPTLSACQQCVQAATSPCVDWNFSGPDNVADCFHNSDPTWVEKCVGAYRCAVTSGDSCAADATGLNKCYCGATPIETCFTGAASSLPAGNCQVEVEAATGCNNAAFVTANYQGNKYKCVEGLMTDNTTPSFSAYYLTLCTAHPQGCGPQCPLPRPSSL